jgi:hypothetical protein
MATTRALTRYNAWANALMFKAVAWLRGRYVLSSARVSADDGFPSVPARKRRLLSRLEQPPAHRARGAAD